MQISKRQLDPKFESQLKEIFAQLVADITKKDKAQIFLNDFLSETEYIALAKRLAIIIYLNKGKSYEDIKKEVKVSSATIASVQKAIEEKRPGFTLALTYIKAEEWAGKWADKITGWFGK